MVNSGTLFFAGNLVKSQRTVHRTQFKGERDPPWCVDHLQQGRKVLCVVVENSSRTPVCNLRMDARQLGENVPEFGGGKRDGAGVNPEYSTPTQDIHVPIVKIKRIVTSVHPFAAGLSDVIA